MTLQEIVVGLVKLTIGAVVGGTLWIAVCYVWAAGMSTILDYIIQITK
jgi:hypothetical protein